MVSFASHELRTPLNSIIAMLETMINNPNKNYLKNAILNAKYLLCMTNDLLDLAQIKVNKFKLNIKKFNLKYLLVEILEMFQIQAFEQQINLNMNYDCEEEIHSDKNRIRQILINLLGNSFKFTLNGKICVNVEKYDEFLIQISVEDTGIGIKQENLSKLFTVFGKIDGEEAINLNQQGVGLGLVISNMIAYQLGDNNNQKGIEVESEYGYGSIFKFKIYIHKDEANIISNSQQLYQQALFQDNDDILEE
ncbi:hypothetical protein IMG5_089000, partial [Ichthyophthirius multifiliis]